MNNTQQASVGVCYAITDRLNNDDSFDEVVIQFIKNNRTNGPLFYFDIVMIWLEQRGIRNSKSLRVCVLTLLLLVQVVVWFYGAPLI
jgi:hypothetical protein